MTVMYTKLFSSLLSSSIWSEELETRVVFVTLLAMADREGYVYGSPAGLAALARLPIQDTIKALDKLKSPDEYSSDLAREKGRDGRRIEAIPQGGWFIINYAYYRDLADADVRRAQNRAYKRKERQSAIVSNGQHQSASVTPSESEAESEAATESEKPKRERARFAPPSVEEVREYASKMGYTFDPEIFVAKNEARGWMYGKTPMKSWKAACMTWQKQEEANAKYERFAKARGALSDYPSWKEIEEFRKSMVGATPGRYIEAFKQRFGVEPRG